MIEGDHPREIEERYLAIRERMWRAAEAGGREPAAVKLVAVTKTFEAEDILPGLRQGHRSFGENRVQEAMHKWPAFREQFPDMELHLIGPLQTNKVREAVALFDCIETLDRPKLAAALAAEMLRQNRAPKLFIQVNIGLEAQKAGIPPAEADAFISGPAGNRASISGLMCIPPLEEEPVPHF